MMTLKEKLETFQENYEGHPALPSLLSDMIDRIMQLEADNKFLENQIDQLASGKE